MNLVQCAIALMAGFWEVSTANHGGLLLSAGRQAARPDPLRPETPAYEEDVDWTLVILAFEAEIAASRRIAVATLIAQAYAIARNWPDALRPLHRHAGRAARQPNGRYVALDSNRHEF